MADRISNTAVERLVCPKCRAKPGQPCRTTFSRVGIKTGLPTTPHVDRTRPIHDTWFEAFREGMTEQRAWHEATGRWH